MPARPGIRGSLRRLRGRWARRGADSGTVRNPWNEDAPYDYTRLWVGSPTVYRHMNAKLSGDPDVDWLSRGLRRFAPALGEGEGEGPKPIDEYRCLLLGANDGQNALRRICEAGFNGEIVATDIAETALARAQHALSRYGNVTYQVADLNVDRFEGPFDYIVAEGVLHHIAEIEPCLRHLHEILEPDGILIANEYEGPFRFQLSDLQLEWINAALAAVPAGLRPNWEGDPNRPPDARHRHDVRYVPPSESSIAEVDPTEALSGPALRRLIPEIFHVVERTGVGGPILSYVTEHFPYDQTETDPHAGRFVKVLIEIEDALIDTGILEDEYFYYELGRRDAAMPPV